MSDITAKAWSEMAMKKLLTLEQTCADDDLFCVGYLIPQVELVEVSQTDSLASKEQWHQWLTDFVDDCIANDTVNEADATRIREIASGLTG